eukprot:753858-Hanusia_phi.AAC.7
MFQLRVEFSSEDSNLQFQLRTDIILKARCYLKLTREDPSARLRSTSSCKRSRMSGFVHRKRGQSTWRRLEY